VRALLLITVLALVAGRDARADSCTGIMPSGGRFATCFDNGNRLSLTAGTDGLGGSVAVRHIIHFDDEPDLVWKLEHVMLESTHATLEDRFTGVVYQGRYLRHARDGHIVIPLGTPKKIFLPFDVGGLAEVGRISWQPDSSIAHVGVVKIAALLDFSRTRTFRQRLAIGPVARWDVDVDRDNRALAEHFVSPFTSALLELKNETLNGRTTATLSVEAGTVWRNESGWTKQVRAEAALERIVLAINDRPIALVMGARYDSGTDEAVAHIGARVVLVQRRDSRVSLDPPSRQARR
jgi:hypothetical protein